MVGKNRFFDIILDEEKEKKKEKEKERKINVSGRQYRLDGSE